MNHRDEIEQQMAFDKLLANIYLRIALVIVEALVRIDKLYRRATLHFLHTLHA